MEWIDSIILGLIDSYSTNNVYELCDCLGIEIRYVEPSNIVLDGHEAYYFRNFNNSEIIFISNELDDSLKEFALKHELGHALCHDELSAAYSLTNTGKLEKQANYFAIKLTNIKFDEVYFREMTLEQIASFLELPYEPLKQIVNL